MTSQLQALVAARLELAGVTRRQIEAACDRVPTVQWPRLPLYTELALDGEPLQRFLDVRCGLELEDFVAVYEEFVAGYLLTREHARTSPMAWLTRSLNLSAADAAQLFSDGSPRRGRRAARPRDLMMMLVALAALANQTYGGVIVYNEPARFAVTVGGAHDAGKTIGFDFGVMDGKPITNLGARSLGPRVAIVKHSRALHMLGRGRPVTKEDSNVSLFSQLKALGQVHPEVAGEAEAWNLALAILRHRARGHVPRNLNQAIAEGVDPVGFRQAIRLASGFQEFEYPYRQLQLLLVPAYVKPDQFRELFGSAPKHGLTQQRIEQWKLALDHLSDSIKEKQ